MSSIWRAICGAVAITLSLTAPQASAAAPVDVTREMDRYINDPRSPQVYRALAGLGDPYFGLDTDGTSGWQDSEDARTRFGLGYGGYCRTDYALKIYGERASKLGAQHPYVNHWVKVQRAVFSACDGWGERPAAPPLPPPITLADPAIAALQRADRAYQAASRLFYASQDREARAAFARISSQRGPHQSAATFMIVAIDAGSGAYRANKPERGAIAQAQSLLSNRATKSLRAAGHELIGWMGATADTRETRAAQVAVTLDALHLPLAGIRSDPQLRDRYDRAAADLPALSTDFANQDWWLSGAIPQGYFGSLALAQKARTDRLAAFHLLPDACRAAECSMPYSVKKFIEARQEDSGQPGDGDAWRVAALQQADGYVVPDLWGEIDLLVAQVQRVPTDQDVALLVLLADEQLCQAFSGARAADEDSRPDRLRAAALMARWPWPTSMWFARRYDESLRRLATAGQVAEARSLRDQVEARLGDSYRGYASAGLLLLLAGDRDTFVRDLVKHQQAGSPLVDRLPIDELTKLATDGRIAARDRARFARIAWTRTYLIKKRIPKPLDRLMRELNPDLAAAWRSKIGARTRDHALLLDVLRTPGMNLRAASRADASYDGTEQYKLTEIDVYEHSLNNWWCGPHVVDFNQRDETALAGSIGHDGSRASAEEMLGQSWAWHILDREERDALADHPMAPRLLAEAAIKWGQRANPRRPKGADEALALAVKATRYGCQQQGGHGAWSKMAWDVLHQRFPDSAAARRTRWWFDCKHFTYGCRDRLTIDQALISAREESPSPTTRGEEVSKPPRVVRNAEIP